MALPAFHFKKFSVEQGGAAHPVGTDGVLLGAWADVEGCQRILDIGTGTGLVALMLAQRTAASAITAVEIHPDSAALARRNFAASPWADRLEAVESSVQEFAQRSGQQFDLIVSNPPYFSETVVSPDVTRRLGRHTSSLSPGELLENAKQLMSDKGRLCVVLPVMEGRRLCEMAVSNGLYCTEEVEVRSRPEKPAERLLLRFERDPYRFARKKLNLYTDDKGGVYSSDFKRLTKDFYL
ncbi:MAG: tRNA1(Val) (adenine(37)-N6)-methyltransferase [Saprospiraceae bacterium]|nr:tRNA1(Val) (adenine(37)-N6)-methyltransferase [Saprospiraceae bacterium]